jgi:hypothetical protein
VGSMNWRRGLLRLWVVASAIWILLICIYNSDQLSKIFIAIEPSPGQGAVTLSPGPYACWVTR